MFIGCDKSAGWSGASLGQECSGLSTGTRARCRLTEPNEETAQQPRLDAAPAENPELPMLSPHDGGSGGWIVMCTFSATVGPSFFRIRWKNEASRSAGRMSTQT